MKFEELYEWTCRHNVKEKTENGFLEVINNLMKDSPYKITRTFGENFNYKLLNITFFKVALTIRVDLEPNLEYIASYANIIYDNNDMGIYKLIFNIEGDVEDDCWLSYDD